MTIEAVDPGIEAHGLAEVLRACVAGGASVSFVEPFSLDDARAYWRGLAGTNRIVLAARDEGRIVGTASLVLDTPPNQPHRADVAKVLVHPDARRRGLARRLMEEIEAVARRKGRTLLTLDTVTGGAAEPMYASLGYERIGAIPDYALLPDGVRLVSTTLFYKRL